MELGFHLVLVYMRHALPSMSSLHRESYHSLIYKSTHANEIGALSHIQLVTDRKVFFRVFQLWLGKPMDYSRIEPLVTKEN